MEARQLALEPLREKYRDLVNDTDFAWLEFAEVYRRQGLLNEELVDDLVRVINWQAHRAKTPLYNVSKSLFDRSVAVALIVLASPVLLTAAVAVKAQSRGPILFTQTRIGRDRVPFKIYKFRTMVTGASRAVLAASNDMQGGTFKARKDARITSVGRILRRWSIDELPQLLNVVIGDMSLVGPRPLPPEDTATIPAEYFKRFAVKPGITGLWQATARDTLDGRLKMSLDCEYVEKRGWKTDLWLLLKTIPTVLSGVGAW